MLEVAKRAGDAADAEAGVCARETVDAAALLTGVRERGALAEAAAAAEAAAVHTRADAVAVAVDGGGGDAVKVWVAEAGFWGVAVAGEGGAGAGAGAGGVVGTGVGVVAESIAAEDQRAAARQAALGADGRAGAVADEADVAWVDSPSVAEGAEGAADFHALEGEAAGAGGEVRAWVARVDEPVPAVAAVLGGDVEFGLAHRDGFFGGGLV